MATPKKLTADAMWKLLQKRYGESDEWVILSEVRNRAGFDASRTADAIAMNMWPSRGLRLHGFEIKVSRSDWVRELRDPAKAEAFHGLVDYWWLVVSDPTFVHDGELPDGWGLLAPRGPGLGVFTEARRHPDVTTPRDFLAALLRRAKREVTPEAVHARTRREGYDEGLAAGRTANIDALQQLRAERDRERATIAEFEEVIGQPIRRWTGQEGLIEALAIVLEGRTEQHRRSIEMAAAQLERIVASIRAVLPEEPERSRSRPDPPPPRPREIG